jgi:hypothetical protein
MDARAIRVSNRAYAALLWLLPGAFRREFAEPMRQTFADLTAARLAEGGPRGMTRVWLAALPDLMGGAAREWTSTIARVVGGSTRWPRYTGAAVFGAAAVLLLVSQALYPANLARPEYLWAYVGLLAALAGLGFALLRSGASSIAAVSLGLAICPLWLLMYTATTVGVLAAFPGAAALIAIAGGRVVARGGRLAAGLRASLTCAVTGAVGLLLANETYSLATMAVLRRDPIYLDEYRHSGQADLAAYIVGESIGGGIYAILASPVLGLAFGLLGVVVGRIVRGMRPTDALTR